jgi:hypothetical protein
MRSASGSLAPRFVHPPCSLPRNVSDPAERVDERERVRQVPCYRPDVPIRELREPRLDPAAGLAKASARSSSRPSTFDRIQWQAASSSRSSLNLVVHTPAVSPGERGRSNRRSALAVAELSPGAMRAVEDDLGWLVEIFVAA